MYYYEAEVRDDIWEYLHNEFDNADLSDLTPYYLMNDVNLNINCIIGFNSDLIYANWFQAKKRVLSAMHELDDIVNDGYITDEQLGYKLRHESYEDIDSIIRLRYATMLIPLIVVDYIKDRKDEVKQ